MTGRSDEPAAPVHVPSYLPAGAPQPVKGCSECARHNRVIEALREDRSVQTDARVLLARHLTEDHRP